MLKRGLHFLRRFLVLLFVWMIGLRLVTQLLVTVWVLGLQFLREVDDKRRRPDLLGHVQNLVEPRHSESHVFGRHTGEVEGVEGHLGGRLSNRLRSLYAAHLARICMRGLEPGFDLSHHPVKRLTGETVLGEHRLTRERGAEENLHEKRAVALDLDRNIVVSREDALLDPIAQPRERFDDINRLQIRRLLGVEPKLNFGVPQQSRNVHRRIGLVVISRVLATHSQDLAKLLTVFLKFLELLLQQPRQLVVVAANRDACGLEVGVGAICPRVAEVGVR
mmetsp:Transcript_73527/g.209259  ORF Transcript_73527/g.209259 Transcript_73527/m.209259 type:complete len:277 (+) Transcript_73527:1336-2166(+)